MKINYVYFTQMIIVFDNRFATEIEGSLDNAVSCAKEAMNEYGFDSACINNKNTNEPLVILENN